MGFSQGGGSPDGSIHGGSPLARRNHRRSEPRVTAPLREAASIDAAQALTQI